MSSTATEIERATGSPAGEVIRVTGMSNQEFPEQYAAAGRLGLVGGTTLIDKAICSAERHVDADGGWSCWSHAFVFQGCRVDGRHWVVESDLEIHRKHIRLGAQENRIDKYFDEKFYSTLAVLDFGLTEEQCNRLLQEGLELVAGRFRYSIRELVGTLIALRRPELRERENLLARKRAFYCSAFVRHLFRQAGVDLAPGLVDKHTTPEHLAHSPLPHATYLLQRAVARSSVRHLARRVGRRVKARLRLARRSREIDGLEPQASS